METTEECVRKEEFAVHRSDWRQYHLRLVSSRDPEPSMSTGRFLKTRRFQAAVLVVTALASALLAGGCATRSAEGWAQTAPAIPPSRTGGEIARLGALGEPVALREDAAAPIRN